MRRFARSAGGALAVAGFVEAARRAWRSPPVWLARMSGSSICSPTAVGWVTDFLNASYYARRPERRDVDDLRLAFAILTTRWHRVGHGRLRASDVLAFHRAFFRERIADAADTPRGTLGREQLFAGAERLLGPWFAEAYADDARRAHGIAFETAQDCAAYRPEHRRSHAKLGDPTPPCNPRQEQVWHTYQPVRVGSAQRAIELLLPPETWPDYASDLGRFTALRSTGLLGQSFEIEIVTALTPRTPSLLRGYVTVSRLLTREENPVELDAYAETLNDRMVRFGRGEPPVFPPGCTPQLALCLDTHEGHFMGRGRNRLLLYDLDGESYLRASGTWDDMPVSLETAYRTAGRKAQAAFWGDDRPESSMLHQIARRTWDR